MSRAKPVQREKHEQALVVELLQKIGWQVYVIGTRRPRGSRCPRCGTFVAEHQGTCQTPGLSDLIAFSPRRYEGVIREAGRLLVFIEAKATGGRLSPAQKAFAECCWDVTGSIEHIVGGYDVVIQFLVEQGFLKATQVPHYRQPVSAQRS
jgi:hypothetical protein